MSGVVLLLSSARELTLHDGTAHPVGCAAAEAVTAYHRLHDAGLDVTVMSPDGHPPTADPNGLSWFFHSPKQDREYLAAVIDTFAPHVDSVRVTLQQNAQLGLGAARRLTVLCQAEGASWAQAHPAVCAVTESAWRHGRPLVEVAIEDDSLGLSRRQIENAGASFRQDCERVADERRKAWSGVAGFGRPVALSSVPPGQLDEFDGMVTPGGYGSMVDLHDDPHVRALLLALQAKDAPIAAVGYGSAVLLSAPERDDGLWMFDGYRLTCISDDEENQTGTGQLGLSWRLDEALKDAGAVFDDGPAWVPRVIVDRNLITGQNPNSVDATVTALLERLNARSGTHGSDRGLGRSTARQRLPEEPTPTTTGAAHEVVRSFLAAWAVHDVGGMLALLDRDVRVVVHPLSVDERGPDALRDVLSSVLRAFPDQSIVMNRLITTGDVVTALLTAGGTQSNPFAGAPAMNKHVSVEQAWRFVVADGRISAVTAYWCQAQLYRRLAVRRYDEVAAR